MADKPTSPTGINSFSSPSKFSTFTRNVDKTAMAPFAPSVQSGVKKALDISNLMSPPEPPRFDSFSQRRDSNSMGPAVSDVRRLRPIPPLSPPISPATKADDHPADAPSTVTPIKDPILYPTQDATNSPQQRPLFSQDDSIEVRRLVDEHVNTRPADFFREATPPKREDYELFLYFHSEVMKQYCKDPKAWLKREREFLLADRRDRARRNPLKLQPILPAKPQQIRKETQRAKVAKPAKVVKASQSHATAPRPIRSYPPTAASQPNRLSSATSPDPSPRRAVAPNREDKDFESLPNYCPPTDSLPRKANSLKVDWKGTPIDLSCDPHRHLLHPDEIALAANLRLDCATYLTSKRRMFIRRLECLGVGKEFRKTDAQQACKIDVNKASKLWTAFDKVGWLDKVWMNPHM